MGLFGKLFGGAGEPEKPDDYHLASSIASTIDLFVSTQGLEALINGDWSVGLRRDYRVSLTRMGGNDDTRAIVRLDELEEMSDFKRIQSDSLMGDSPLGCMATDKLAMAVLRKIKEQSCTPRDKRANRLSRLGESIMGLFGKLFGGGVDRNSLIKELAKSRVRNDPMAGAMGFDESMVDSLSGMQLACLPEGTIVTIVETWAVLNKKGVPDEEILIRIENFRSRFSGGGNLPNPLTLSSYVIYQSMLNIESISKMKLASQ